MDSRTPFGLVVFAHGSRIEAANEAVRKVAGEAAQKCGAPNWEAAFLELGNPDLEQAVARLVTRGLRRIVVTPYFLTMGVHLQRDLPALIRRIKDKHQDVTITCSQPLDGHPALGEILSQRAAEAITP